MRGNEVIFQKGDTVVWATNLSGQRRRELVKHHGRGPFVIEGTRPTPDDLRHSLQSTSLVTFVDAIDPYTDIACVLLKPDPAQRMSEDELVRALQKP